MQKIDDTTYAIKEINRYKTTNAKTQIILASSLRKNSYHISRLLHKDFGNSKRWNTYTINRDGVVFQHYDNKYHSDFMGVKEVDKKSISIVVENMGSLFETPKGNYINWLNEICEKEKVVEKEWQGYEFWELFPDIQIESLASLCKDICSQYNIPKKCIDFHHYHKDASKFRGIVFKSNFFEDSNDINPLFDIKKFNEMLRED